jgi:hypothetical protein
VTGYTLVFSPTALNHMIATLYNAIQFFDTLIDQERFPIDAGENVLRIE